MVTQRTETGEFRPRPVPCRALWTLLLMWGGWLTAVALAGAQDLNDLELLPPIGASSPAAEATPDTIVPPEALAVPAPAEGLDAAAAPGSWWTQPTTWFASPIWDFGAELGINGAAGNAESFSILAAANGKRDTESNTLEWDIKHGKTQTGGLETQNYAILNSRWDWKIDPLSFLYNKNTIEYDEFKAFDLRLVLSGGYGRHLIKNDLTTFTGRLGAGTSHEIGGPDDSWVPEANLGTDFEHALSPRQKLKFTSDYYPSWENFQDYRLVANAHWEILLDEETNLSLKFGVVDRYDSTPNGLKPNDITYFATLLWKL